MGLSGFRALTNLQARRPSPAAIGGGGSGSARPARPSRQGVCVSVQATGDLATSDGHALVPGDSAARRVEARPCRVLGLCEIANFAALRRHLGRPRADALVADVSRRILATEPDLRVLTAGRAFVEIAFEAASPAVALTRIQRVRDAFRTPIDLDGEAMMIQLHLGGAAAPIENCDEVRLTEAAESVLEEARRGGAELLVDLSGSNPVFDRLTLMRELPRAIARGEMFLQYQPKVHVRRQQIASAEALVRWQHPERGLILPGEFISLVEEAGAIGALTLWTLRQVIADQRRLAAQEHDLPLFLNISGMLLADEAFVEEACAIVAANPEARLGFEITETAVIRDPQSAIRNLQRFADIGVQLAIDDYGAGLSSLAYLKQLPARELKIDKMFVLQLTSSNRDPLIVRSTIDLAHALEMEVTAEGVETPSALALLSVMGCDLVQGFLISRPLGFDAFCKFLADDGHLPATGAARASFLRPESFWKRA